MKNKGFSKKRAMNENDVLTKASKYLGCPLIQQSLSCWVETL